MLTNKTFDSCRSPQDAQTYVVQSPNSNDGAIYQHFFLLPNPATPHSSHRSCPQPNLQTHRQPQPSGPPPSAVPTIPQSLPKRSIPVPLLSPEWPRLRQGRSSGCILDPRVEWRGWEMRTRGQPESGILHGAQSIHQGTPRGLIAEDVSYVLRCRMPR